jgi:hypothetical protein
LTEEMKNSPHGLSKLELLKVVGELKWTQYYNGFKLI